jgi:hypothetical protein
LLSPEIVRPTKTPFDESYTHGEERGPDIWHLRSDKNLLAGSGRNLSPYLTRMRRRFRIERGIETSDAI